MAVAGKEGIDYIIVYVCARVVRYGGHPGTTFSYKVVHFLRWLERRNGGERDVFSLVLVK